MKCAVITQRRRHVMIKCQININRQARHIAYKQIDRCATLEREAILKRNKRQPNVPRNQQRRSTALPRNAGLSHYRKKIVMH